MEGLYGIAQVEAVEQMRRQMEWSGTGQRRADAAATGRATDQTRARLRAGIGSALLAVRSLLAQRGSRRPRGYADAFIARWNRS